MSKKKSIVKESAGSDTESQEAMMKRSSTSQNDESEMVM